MNRTSIMPLVKSQDVFIEDLVSTKISVILSQARDGLLFAVVLCSLLGLVFVNRAGWTPFLWWYGTMACAYVFRYSYILHLRATHRADRGMLVRVASICAFTGWMAVMSLPVFSSYLTTLDVAYMSSIMVGWTAVSVSLLSVTPRIYSLFVTACLSGVFYAWIGHADGIGLIELAGALILGGMLLSRLCQQIWQQHVRENDLNIQLKDALGIAKSADQAKTRFLASASHDLRQPLHVISMMTSALGLRKHDGVTMEMVSALQKANTSLTSLLDSLLDISKLDAGQVPIRKDIVDLASLMRQLFEEFEPQIHAKGLRALLDVRGPVGVMSDPVLLRRIVSNLLSNAVKFTDKGSIALRMSDHGHQLTLEIQDTGQGIAKEDLEAVFQEFFQVHNAGRDPNAGMGLGLSIVRRLAHLLDIQVSLRSEVGVGTTVTLVLPLDSWQTLTPRPNDVSVGSASRQYFGLRILVLDDNEAVLQSMAHLLNELGCEACLARTLEEALAKAPEWRPDALIVDLRLAASLNGMDAIGRIRAVLGNLPALLMTGDTAPSPLLAVVETGVRLCHKPITLQGLLSELEILRKQDA